jgi:predicted amidohydrolase
MKTTSTVRTAAVQFTHRPGDRVYNLQRIDDLAREAADGGGRLICFPEMCITGYWHVRHLSRREIEALAEPVPAGLATLRLQALAKELDAVIGAGLVEIDEKRRLFNTYVVCDPDGSVHFHRKIHAFISEHIDSGNAYTVFPSSLGCTIGVLTCYDNNLIENARATALLGADVLLAPHQTGGVRSRSPHAMGPIDPDLWHNRERDPEAITAAFRGPSGREWLMRWLPARAHDNGMFLVFSNGVGLDDDEVRTGNAMVIDCYGRIVAETWQPRDEVVLADMDLSLLEMSSGRRWMNGRKPELYGILTEQTGREVDPRTARFS